MQTFLLYNWILLNQNFNFCKFEKLFAESKRRTKELSNDVSFVIFGHQIWDLEGGGQIDYPPPAYPGFQVAQQR